MTRVFVVSSRVAAVRQLPDGDAKASGAIGRLRALAKPKLVSIDGLGVAKRPWISMNRRRWVSEQPDTRTEHLDVDTGTGHQQTTAEEPHYPGTGLGGDLSDTCFACCCRRPVRRAVFG